MHPLIYAGMQIYFNYSVLQALDLGLEMVDVAAINGVVSLVNILANPISGKRAGKSHIDICLVNFFSVTDLKNDPLSRGRIRPRN